MKTSNQKLEREKEELNDRLDKIKNDVKIGNKKTLNDLKIIENRLEREKMNR